MDIVPAILIVSALVCLAVAWQRFVANATDHYRLRWATTCEDYLARTDALGGPWSPGGQQVTVPRELTKEHLLHLTLPLQAMLLWSSIAADLYEAYRDTDDERLYDPQDPDVCELRSAYTTAVSNADEARHVLADALARERTISARRAMREHSAKRKLYLYWRQKVQQLGPDEWFLLDLQFVYGVGVPASYAHRRLLDPTHRLLLSTSAVAAIRISED